MAVKVNNLPCSSCIDLRGEKWTERYCRRRNANTTSKEKQKRKGVRRTGWGASREEGNVTGKRSARAPQAFGYRAPAASRAPCASGTAPSAAPRARWGATPRTSPLAPLPRGGRFPFLLCLLVVCGNTSGADVCRRHRGSVLAAQHSAGWSPEQPVLTVLLINMLQRSYRSWQNVPLRTALGTRRPSFLLPPFY